MSDKVVTISDFPFPPEGSTFRLREVKKISVPHPYCIGPGHVGMASDKFGGILGEAAIEAAERKGIGCQWGPPGRRCQLSYKEHTTDLTLVIEVSGDLHRLNDVPGLHAYLLAIKAQAEALGVKAFAFPKASQTA